MSAWFVPQDFEFDRFSGKVEDLLSRIQAWKRERDAHKEILNRLAQVTAHASVRPFHSAGLWASRRTSSRKTARLSGL